VGGNKLNQEGKISKKHVLKIIKKPTPSGTDKEEDFHRHHVRLSDAGGCF